MYVTLAVVAAVALAGWLVLLAACAVASHPRRPRPGPPTMELVGDEPPAVVNLLTNGWRLTRTCVPATLLDLAARRIVSIEEIGPDRFVVRMPSALPSDLAPYEQQVLDLVRSLAVDGVVPCEALTTGPEGLSRPWWNRFRKAVLADAHRRGLSRGRWGGRVRGLLTVTAAVPAAVGAAAVAAFALHRAPLARQHPVLWIEYGVAAWVALSFLPSALRAERDTDAGLAAASRWLGVRRRLHDDVVFADLSPAAVVLWARYLSYGAAMGVASGAVRALPMGSESDREAWSSYGGRWHHVSIRYPRLTPWWGRSPVATAIVGAALTFIGTQVLRATPSVSRVAAELARGDGGVRVPSAVLGPIVAVVVALGAAAAVSGLACLVAGVADLGRRRRFEGRVLRVKRIVRSSAPWGGTRVTVAVYVAIDDGTSGRVRALRCTAGVAAAVRRGEDVRVTISRRLAHVSCLDRVDTTHSEVRKPSPVVEQSRTGRRFSVDVDGRMLQP